MQTKIVEVVLLNIAQERSQEVDPVLHQHIKDNLVPPFMETIMIMRQEIAYFDIAQWMEAGQIGEIGVNVLWNVMEMVVVVDLNKKEFEIAQTLDQIMEEQSVMVKKKKCKIVMETIVQFHVPVREPGGNGHRVWQS